MNENHCVCCGAVIPEGGQVCKQCEKKYEIRWGDSIIQAFYKKGFKDGQIYQATGYLPNSLKKEQVDNSEETT